MSYFTLALFIEQNCLSQKQLVNADAEMLNCTIYTLCVVLLVTAISIATNADRPKFGDKSNKLLKHLPAQLSNNRAKRFLRRDGFNGQLFAWPGGELDYDEGAFEE